MFNKTIQLASKTYVNDSLGQRIPTVEYKKVFAKQKSISQSEFFAAGQTDLKPSCVFVVRAAEYQGEDELLYNGDKFTIYRTFNTKNEMIELYCEKRFGGK